MTNFGTDNFKFALKWLEIFIGWFNSVIYSTVGGKYSKHSVSSKVTDWMNVTFNIHFMANSTFKICQYLEDLFDVQTQRVVTPSLLLRIGCVITQQISLISLIFTFFYNRSGIHIGINLYWY